MKCLLETFVLRVVAEIPSDACELSCIRGAIDGEWNTNGPANEENILEVIRVMTVVSSS